MHPSRFDHWVLLLTLPVAGFILTVILATSGHTTLARMLFTAVALSAGYLLVSGIRLFNRFARTLETES